MNDKTKNTLKLLLLIAYLVAMIVLAFCNIVFILNQKSLVSILITGILFVMTFGGYPFVSYKLFPEKMEGKKELIYQYIVFAIALVIFVFLALGTHEYGICIANQEEAQLQLYNFESITDDGYTEALEKWEECEDATWSCYMHVNTLLISFMLFILLLNPLILRLLKHHWESKKDKV